MLCPGCHPPGKKTAPFSPKPPPPAAHIPSSLRGTNQVQKPLFSAYLQPVAKRNTLLKASPLEGTGTPLCSPCRCSQFTQLRAGWHSSSGERGWEIGQHNTQVSGLNLPSCRKRSGAYSLLFLGQIHVRLNFNKMYNRLLETGEGEGPERPPPSQVSPTLPDLETDAPLQPLSPGMSPDPAGTHSQPLFPLGALTRS